MLNNSLVSFFWRWGLVLTVSQLLALFGNRAFAQIQPDTTLGAESSVVNSIDALNEGIDGGAIRGANLFHSFREFNVGEGRGVYFASPEGISNILSRVTGGNPSNIFGKLGVLGDANLFLLNPNGIVFGENASLDIQGSFVASTADSLKFSDGNDFSATNAQTPPLLKVSVPAGLQFSNNPEQIVVRGDSQGTRQTTQLIDTLKGLRVPGNQTLALVGGELRLEGATLKTDGGRIELGSVMGSTSVKLNAIAKGWSLGYEEVQDFGDIQLSQQATVDASGAGAGDIQVQARNVSLTGGSGLDASTLTSISGGTLKVNASELIELAGTSKDGQIQSGLFAIVYSGDKDTRGANIAINAKGLLVRDGAQIQAINQPLSQGSSGNLQVKASNYVNLIGDSALFSSGLFTQSEGIGQGSELSIETKNLSVQLGAQVSASAFSQGSAGKLTVVAENIDLSGTSVAGVQFPSGLFVQSQGIGNAGELDIFSKRLVVRDGAHISVSSVLDSVGDAGTLQIETAQLIIQNNAQITAGTSGNARGGKLSVKASESVNLAGTNSLLTTQTLGNERGGDLLVDTKNLIIENGAQISTGTFGQGVGGNLTVTAKDLIRLSGFRSGFFTQSEGIGNAGKLNIETGKLIIQDEAQISASASDIGNGADIQLKADSLVLFNDAQITSRSLGRGNSGDILIDISKDFNANKGRINTSAQTSTGGDIRIIAKNIRLFNDTDIRTNVFSGEGGGGNITLTANTIIALDDSDILSFASDGKGGDITFNTAGFFSTPLYRPSPPTRDAATLNALDGNNRVNVNASGAVSGAITGVPDITFIENSLTDLPENQIDTNALIANSCIARTNQQEGTFFITGSGGLPIRPSDAPLSPYSTGNVQSIPSNSEKSPASTTRRPWKIGDPVVEPQGVYRLSNGQLVLSRECR